MPWIPGLAVRILMHEQARTGSTVMIDAVGTLVRRRQLAGITVTRGQLGWHRHPSPRPPMPEEHKQDHPLTIEILDRVDRIEPVLPEIAALVTSGVLTVSSIRLYVPATHLLVSDVMHQIDSPVADPETLLSEVLRWLLQGGKRLIPVVSPERMVLGVVTLGALVQRIDPTMEAHLAVLHSPPHLQSHLERLAAGHSTRDVMLTPAHVVRSDLRLDAAARLLTARGVTRVPVVDEDEHLVGMLSEHDVARALVAPAELVPALATLQRASPEQAQSTSSMDARGQPERPLALGDVLRLSVLPGLGEPLTAGMLAHRQIPFLPEATPLDAAVKLLYDTPDCIALVMSPSSQLRGILDERALLQHALPESNAGLRKTLMRFLVRSPAQLLAAIQHQSAQVETVADVMRPAMATVVEELPAADALAQMLTHPQADPAVVIAADGRPSGILWRDEALRALAET